MKLSRIMVPTDLSAHSYEGLQTAEVLARQCGAELVIVHVLDPSGQHGDWPTSEAARDHIEQVVAAVNPASPDVAASHVVLEGETADEIVRYARQQHIDLIVMGSHGRTGIPRVLTGSVTTRVLQHASCAVLTVRPQIRLRGEIKAWAHRVPHPHEPHSPMSSEQGT